jgi:lipoprotein-releasing system permease protein
VKFLLFNKTEQMIAFRYIKSRRVEGFISISAWFSLIGIMLGVATLIVVMSVMNGFRTELVDRILGINGHLVIYSKSGPFISDYNDIIKKISDVANVDAVTPHLEGQALAKTKATVSGVIIRGLNWSDLAAKKLLWKSLNQKTIDNYKNKEEIIIGYRLAQRLNVNAGDFITLISPNGMETALGVLPIKQNFKIAGLFDIGMYEYDNNFIFIPWKKAELFLATKSIAHGIEVFLKNQKFTSIASSKIKLKLNNDLLVIDWKKRNSAFMSALAVEKNVMFVQTKKSDIALMRTMGASKYVIIRIFILTASIIGFLGTLFGAFLGIIVASYIEVIRGFLTTLLGSDLFSAEIYFLSKLPSNININEVSTVIFISLSLTLLASVFPAWKASRISPAEALRYE